MARKPAVIRPSKQLEESLREALLSEIDSALSECDRLASWEQPERREAVHELRRALKRFRAGASLCKGAVDAVEVRAVQEEVRATAERLSATRDRDVLIETIGDVTRIFPATSRRSVHAIMVAVLAPDKATTVSADWLTAAAIIRGQLEAMRMRLTAVDLRAISPDSVADAISRRWRRARRSASVPWDAAHLESLHDVRKHCQRLALQIQLVAPIGPRRRLERLSKALSRVVREIGADRDLGLLAGLLAQRKSEFPDPRQVEDVLMEIRERRQKRLGAAQRHARRALRWKSRQIRGIVMRGR
jgi:hypothetical protein